MRSRAVAGVVAAMFVAACGGPTAPRADLSVTVSTADAALHLSNRGSVPIGFFPVEAGALVLIDWVPCAGGPGCPVLQPGADTTIAYSDVTGYYAGAQDGVVYWWGLRPAPFPKDGFVVDTMHAVHFTF